MGIEYYSLEGNSPKTDWSCLFEIGVRECALGALGLELLIRDWCP